MRGGAGGVIDPSGFGCLCFPHSWIIWWWKCGWTPLSLFPTEMLTNTKPAFPLFSDLSKGTGSHSLCSSSLKPTHLILCALCYLLCPLWNPFWRDLASLHLLWHFFRSTRFYSSAFLNLFPVLNCVSQRTGTVKSSQSQSILETRQVFFQPIQQSSYYFLLYLSWPLTGTIWSIFLCSFIKLIVCVRIIVYSTNYSFPFR